jgi:phosphate starvation-inducible protein PhoH
LEFTLTRSTRKSSLTSTDNTSLERRARRISKQQKHLDKEINASHVQPVSLIGARSRAIRFQDILEIEPLTDTQHDFFDSYEDGAQACVMYGSAGTGKTFLAIHHALTDVLVPESPYKKLIIVRSCVASRDMGHLPGTVDEKMEQYELPYHSICSEILGRKDAYEKLKDSGKIEFISSSYLRGMTFNDSIVVFDELQNETFATIGTLITRTGKNTKLILVGDGAQNDLVHSKHDVSGFRDFITVTRNMSEFRHFRFTSDDIVRSGICKNWIIECEKLGL